MANFSIESLIHWSRALKHGLDIGLSPVKILNQQAKNGPRELRDTSRQLAEKLADGEGLHDSMTECKGQFPTLYLQMVKIGERAGRLPMIFEELEKYYETLSDAKRKLRNALIKPCVTYVIATFVITLLIFILGQLPSVSGRPIDVLGIGLSGTTGAIAFFLGSCAFAGIVIFSAYVFARSESTRSKFEGFALSLPVIGSCVQAFALHRFCLAMHATIEAGMKSDESLKSSLQVTANERYLSIAAPASAQVRKGNEISEVLENYGSTLFPESLLQTIILGDETGRLSELMEKESKNYREEANRKLLIVVQIISWLVYGMVAVLMIVAIFKVFNNSLGQNYRDAFDAVENPEKWMRGQ